MLDRGLSRRKTRTPLSIELTVSADTVYQNARASLLLPATRSSLCTRAEREAEILAKFSNSIIEAWWRALKHQWLFLHSLDSVTTVRRLVEFYVQEHNGVLPHSAFRGQTPDEMYFGTGDAVPADLTAHAAAARRARVEANRAAACRANLVRDRHHLWSPTLAPG